MTVKLKEGVPTCMRWQAGISFDGVCFQDQGNLTGSFTKTGLKYKP